MAPTRFKRLGSRLLLQLQPSGFDSPLLLPRDSFNKLKEKRQHNCAARFLAIFLGGGGAREKNGSNSMPHPSDSRSGNRLGD